MNRLVLIGNGFDQAHGLKTSYKDFIYWYWKQRVLSLYNFRGKTSDDGLCRFTILTYDSWFDLFFYNQVKISFIEDKDFFDVTKDKDVFGIEYSPLFERIHKSIEIKKWVDIENDYYGLLKEYLNENSPEEKIVALNSELQLLQEKLVEYLRTIEISDKLIRTNIRRKIYAPFNISDFSSEGKQALKDHVVTGVAQDTKNWDAKLSQYGSICYTSGYVSSY